jgi:D-3-phosphoglycerate dehydrogenase/(S)-sulfolactate dehydrogenase
MRILVSDALNPEAIRLLSSRGHEVLERPDITGEELTHVLKGYDALIVRGRTRVTREVLAGAGGLRVICRAGSGVDNIDLDAAREKDIAVFNTPGANSTSVAELTWGLILAVHRRLAAAAASTAGGLWEKKKFSGHEISGRTLGVIGLGQIGKQVATIGLGFGCRLVAHDPQVEVPAAVPGAEAVNLDQLLAASDIVTLHLPLTAGTRHLLDADRLSAMKKGAVLVNCARGGLVDEKCLHRLLIEGHLAGAALDAFEQEPPEGSPLLGLPQVVSTPHIGAATSEAQARAGMRAAGAVHAFLTTGEAAGRVI